MEIITNNGMIFIISENQFSKIDGKQLCYDKNVGYVLIKINNKWIRLHRFLTNAQQGEIVDHANRNKLDYSEHNLRKVTKSENNVNRNSAGIYFDKAGNRWRACISVNNKTLKLGSFKTKEAAIIERRNAEKKYFPNVFS